MLSTIIISRTDSEAKSTIASVSSLHPQVLLDINQTNTSFGKRKNSLIKKAKGDWILVLDTDEIASPELVEEIRKQI